MLCFGVGEAAFHTTGEGGVRGCWWGHVGEKKWCAERALGKGKRKGERARERRDGHQSLLLVLFRCRCRCCSSQPPQGAPQGQPALPAVKISKTTKQNVKCMCITRLERGSWSSDGHTTVSHRLLARTTPYACLSDTHGLIASHLAVAETLDLVLEVHLHLGHLCTTKTQQQRKETASQRVFGHTRFRAYTAFRSSCNPEK